MMVTWIMAHPWMALVLTICALSAVEGIVTNICKAVIEKWHTKERMNTLNFYNTPHEKNTKE